MSHTTRVLTRSDVESLLSMPECIRAVEDAFRRRGQGGVGPAGVLGLHLDGGGIHIKAAVLDLARRYVVAKVNANFPGNVARHGLPTIQGALVLTDGSDGRLLALMDSISITTLRTAATSAVAARHLAAAEVQTVAFIGCGIQAAAHADALRVVRPFEEAAVFDTERVAAERFAELLRTRYEIIVHVCASAADCARGGQIVVTTTPSRHAFLRTADLQPGAFVAAVGADNGEKSELAPQLLAHAAVIVDDLAQCSSIGDLHHAIAAGLMTREQVRAELAQVVCDPTRGRHDVNEIVVFDSTGVALEDVAAAALVYERACELGLGLELRFGE